VAGQYKKWKNPFYLLLAPIGGLFCVTSFAYGFMAFQVVNASRAAAALHVDHPLYVWLRSHGTTAMLAELAALAVLTIGAIGTDHWWMQDRPQPADKQAGQVPNDSATEVVSCE